MYFNNSKIVETPLMIEACRKYIEERIFPIMYLIKDDYAVINGTGFIINHNSSLFLVTARHVLDEEEGLDCSKIIIPILGQNKEMWSLPHKPYLSEKSTNADFAIVPLNYNKSIIKNIFWKSFSLNSFYQQPYISNRQKILIYGFPSVLQDPKPVNSNLQIGALSFTTEIFSGDYSEVENYNPTIDILFDYKKQINVNGEIQDLPKLNGISGSAMFCIKHTSKGVWSPENNLKIIGIEKSIIKNKYIRATQSNCLKKSISEWIKKINKAT